MRISVRHGSWTWRALFDDRADLLARQANVDVSNNGWGGRSMIDDYAPGGLIGGVVTAVTDGRNGLGTVMVFAAGNHRHVGSSATLENLTSNRYSIAVGSVRASGDVSSFSNPGDSLFVVAPGESTTIIDCINTIGYNSGAYAQ